MQEPDLYRGLRDSQMRLAWELENDVVWGDYGLVNTVNDVKLLGTSGLFNRAKFYIKQRIP